jgi:hypothetical protein
MSFGWLATTALEFLPPDNPEPYALVHTPSGGLWNIFRVFGRDMPDMVACLKKITIF